MASKCSGGRELTQLMADHVLGHIDRYMLSSVVNSKGMTYEFREDCGTSGPGFDNLLVALSVQGFNLFEQAFFNIKALLGTSTH